MGLESLTSYLSEYGLIFLFIIVLLEYMNLPGFPAGVIMPLAGVWVANSGNNFFVALIISVLAGLIGSWLLYFLGMYGGEFFLDKYIKKFPSHEKYIKSNMEMLRKRGNVGVFISKFIPMVRTIISIPAGVLKLNFIKYTVYSTLGILIWNFIFIASGYFFGDRVLQALL
ncbi:DedA family protein [Clostridium sp. CCUG 7971]|uniref:DedA family protein n=1 Tax=Clostridium sp. CCUG 7971 TaxID=2811414 RepID=UPI001ABB32F9|nr:DedA family protein [Clostridium sp. CCUG 7971]MBO3443509.1 DedA family protein [Clostridium sp. CCUG 7971]